MARWQWFSRKEGVSSTAVIGVGRFGRALALELSELGVDVLAVDKSEDAVQALNGKVAQPVVGDATRQEVLEQLGVDEVDCAVVAVGESVEANILITSTILSFGVSEIYVKAVSDAHVRILKQIGVENIIYPEVDIGRRLAHRLAGSLHDYIELGDGLALVRTTPPAPLLNIPIRDAHIRSRYGVTVISVKHAEDPWSDVTGETVLRPGDQVLVTGPISKAEGFQRLQG